MHEDFKKKIVNCYRNYLGDNLISIVLFGSQARGDASARSDYDVFLVAQDLPEDYLERIRFIRKPLLENPIGGSVSFIARTKKEFLDHFPSLYLDLGLDGIVLYDREDFMVEKLRKIREIIQEAGLRRVKAGYSFHWQWKQYPGERWAIDWSGFHGFQKRR